MKTNFIALAAMAGLMSLSACSKADAAKTTPHAEAAAHTMKVTHVNTLEAKLMMSERPDLVVIDVRTPSEFARGHIIGSINIDFKDASFPTWLKALDPSQDYLIHCRSGGRSTSSLAVFKEAGFSHIIHMDGGMNGWNKAKFPTVK